MNIAIPLKQLCYLAQAAPSDGDHGGWPAIVMISVLVSIIILIGLMKQGRRPRVNRTETEIPPADPLAAARREEERELYARMPATGTGEIAEIDVAGGLPSGRDGKDKFSPHRRADKNRANAPGGRVHTLPQSSTTLIDVGIAGRRLA